MCCWDAEPLTCSDLVMAAHSHVEEHEKANPRSPVLTLGPRPSGGLLHSVLYQPACRAGRKARWGPGTGQHVGVSPGVLLSSEMMHHMGRCWHAVVRSQC
jgi:hypothetical protein